MRIRQVKAYKYDGQLFSNKKEIAIYIQGQKEQLKLKKELEAQGKLKNPIDYKISNGSFDFLLCNNEMLSNEEFKYVTIKSKRFKTAINRILKRKSIVRDGKYMLDYECHILDKYGKRTDYVIDLNNLPKEHEIHKYIH